MSRNLAKVNHDIKTRFAFTYKSSSRRYHCVLIDFSFRIHFFPFSAENFLSSLIFLSFVQHHRERDGNFSLSHKWLRAVCQGRAELLMFNVSLSLPEFPECFSLLELLRVCVSEFNEQRPPFPPTRRFSHPISTK